MLQYLWRHLCKTLSNEHGIAPLLLGAGLVAGGALSGLGSYLGRGKQTYDPYGTLNPEQKAIVQ